MAIFNVYDAILQNGDYSDLDAIEYARGMVWCEVEATEQTIGHSNHIDTVDGVGVYYDYAGDYYFFTDEV